MSFLAPYPRRRTQVFTFRHPVACACSATDTWSVKEVSRFDLFHGHFVQRRNGDVALLLHASEYPAMFLGMQKYMAWHAPVEDLFPTPIFQVSR